MTRVPTYASYTGMLNQTLKNKATLDLYQYQAITGLKSPSYSGYGMSAYSIVNAEASLGVAKNFMENNEILNTEMKLINTSLTSVEKAMNELKSLLTNFSGMDLEDITPDYTGGEISFSDNADVYTGTTITVNGKTYTFAADNTGDNIDISGLTPGDPNYAKDVMNTLKDRLQADDTENFAEFKFEDGKFSFPFYTVDGESSVLHANGVKTGKPHTMSDDQYREMKQLQSQAFTTMKTLADSLNTFANGKYLFGGGVSTEAPVNFPFKNVEEFQKYFDGINIKYPSNSTANLSNYGVDYTKTGDVTLKNNGGNRGTISADNAGAFLKKALTGGAKTTGDLIFNSGSNTVKATEYGAFNTLKPGDTLVIGDAGATHNGSYIIKSVSEDGKTITFEDSTPVRADDTIVDGGGATFSTAYPVGSVINMEGFGGNVSSQVQVTGVSADGSEIYVTMDPSRWPAGDTVIPATNKFSMNTDSYYKGGELVTEKRITDNQSITLDVNANDGAFERMFRALGEIAQGNLVDTRNPLDGGVNVDPNTTLDRITDAMQLVQDSIYSGGRNAGEKNADLYTVQAKMNSNTIVLNNTKTSLTAVTTTLQANVTALKDVDKTEASLKAVLALNNLNASYSVLQAALSTSLLNYIK